MLEVDIVRSSFFDYLFTEVPDTASGIEYYPCAVLQRDLYAGCVSSVFYSGRRPGVGIDPRAPQIVIFMPLCPSLLSL